MTQTHHALGTWTRKIDAYIALTPFTRDVFVRGGVPAARLHVKPNFLSNDPGVGSERGEHFLYVGRLAEEKGVRVLLRAWQSMREPPPLRIVGTGPLAEEVLAVAASTRAIRVSGWLEREDVLTEMKSARALIMPTLWYEGFPFTLCEAMATGCPIIASDIANVRDVLGNGSAGLLFPTGDALSLAALVTRVASDEAQLRPIAAAARMRYEQEYSADVNYARLMQIYQVAAQQHRMTA